MSYSTPSLKSSVESLSVDGVVDGTPSLRYLVESLSGDGVVDGTPSLRYSVDLSLDGVVNVIDFLEFLHLKI